MVTSGENSTAKTMRANPLLKSKCKKTILVTFIWVAYKYSRLPPTPDWKISLVKRVRRDDCINRLLFETSSLAWISDDYFESFLLPCWASKKDSK